MKKESKKKSKTIACQKTDLAVESMQGLGSSPPIWAILLGIFGVSVAGYAYLLYKAATENLEFIVGKKYVWFDFKKLTFNVSIYISVKNTSKFDFQITKPLVQFALNGKKIGDTSATKTTGKVYNIKSNETTDLGAFDLEMDIMQFSTFLFSVAQNGYTLFSSLKTVGLATWSAALTSGSISDAISAVTEEFKKAFLKSGIKVQYKASLQYYLLKVMPISLGFSEWTDAF